MNTRVSLKSHYSSSKEKITKHMFGMSCLKFLISGLQQKKALFGTKNEFNINYINLQVASDKIRGALGSLFILSQNFGYLVVYVAGDIFSFNSVLWLCTAIPFLHMLLFLGVPETPVYLIKQGKVKVSTNVYIIQVFHLPSLLPSIFYPSISHPSIISQSFCIKRPFLNYTYINIYNLQVITQILTRKTRTYVQ